MDILLIIISPWCSTYSRNHTVQGRGCRVSAAPQLVSLVLRCTGVQECECREETYHEPRASFFVWEKRGRNAPNDKKLSKRLLLEMLRKTISKAGAAAFCSTTQDAFSGETESFCDVEGFFFVFLANWSSRQLWFWVRISRLACFFIEPVT